MELKGKRALITGATGTVGSQVAHRLVAESMQVRALVRRSGPIPELPASVELVQGDLADRAAVERAMDGVDLVVHSAAYIGGDWEQARAANVTGTENMLRAAMLHRPDLFVYLSTINVYDIAAGAQITEETPLLSDHPFAYHKTKAEAERLVWAAAGDGLPVTILRPGAILSPHPASTWGPLAVKRVAGAERIRVHPESRLPWVHVANLVDMLMLAITSPAAVGQAYTAIDGDVPFAAFQGQIAGWLGRQVEEETGSGPFTERYAFEKIRSLGYRPGVSYEAAMEEIRLASVELGLVAGGPA